MTEAEWLTADLATRYSYLLPRFHGDEWAVLPRKGRLLLVAWAREVYQQLPWVYRLKVDYAEREADDPALTRSDLRTALSVSLDGIDYLDLRTDREVAIQQLEEQLRDEFGLRPLGDEPPYEPMTAAGASAIERVLYVLIPNPPRSEWLPNSEVFADYFRDIFDNPFRPVSLDPRWRTETVVALANGIYAEKAFDRMSILADALEEAGCDHADMLAHCRGDGPHVRGCWVVDLVLGKE